MLPSAPATAYQTHLLEHGHRSSSHGQSGLATLQPPNQAHVIHTRRSKQFRCLRGSDRLLLSCGQDCREYISTLTLICDRDDGRAPSATNDPWLLNTVVRRKRKFVVVR
jgi:hypothetical protein